MTAVVTAAQEEGFLVDGWWLKHRQAEAVLHEYLGLAAIYLNISRFLNQPELFMSQDTELGRMAYP